MGRIFKHAQRVVVWLGLSSRNSSKAMHLLSDLGRKVVYHAKSFTVSIRHKDYRSWQEFAMCKSYDEESERAIVDLTTRAWFRGVWIWQQVWLADQTQAILQCGDIFMLWDDFKNAVSAIDVIASFYYAHNVDRIRGGIEAARTIVQLRPHQDLHGLLENTRNSVCSDGRDRIYAMLDLAADGPALGI